MNDALQEEVAHTLREKPWLDPEDWSIWRVTGSYGGTRGTFEDCLAIALPGFVTGGAPLFQMLPPLTDVFTPERVTHAREYVLVERALAARLEGAAS